MTTRRTKAFTSIMAIAGVLAVAACEHEKDGFGLTLTTPVEKKIVKPAIPARASKHMIVAGHPLAARAGREILRQAARPWMRRSRRKWC